MRWRLPNLAAIAGRGKRSPIGLDIGVSRVKAVQLEKRGESFRLAAAVVASRASRASRANGDGPFTRAEADALANLLYRGGFEGRRLVVGAPAAWLMQDVLELPPRSSGAPIEQLASAELSRAHRCAPDSFETGSWDLPGGGRTGRGGQVMAVGLSHAQADPLIDVLEAAGMVVDAVDAIPSASARACATRFSVPPAAASSGTHAVLDLGWEAARLMLIYQGAMIYTRTLSEGGLAALHANLCRRLEIEAEVAEYLLSDERSEHAAGSQGHARQDEELDIPEEAGGLIAAHVDVVAAELRTSFAYATQNYPDGEVGSLFLVGGGARVTGFAPRLATALNVEVASIAPADVLECDTRLLRLCGSAVLTTAVGLAMFPE